MITRTTTLAITLCMAGTLGPCGQAHGADIFRSVDVDGNVRFASQALDSSFVLFSSDPGSSRAASHTAPTRRAGMAERSAVRGGPSGRGDDRLLTPLIERIARKHGIDPVLVRAVIDVESGARTAAVSPKGAAGLMQLMPATAAMYGVTERGDAEQNIDAGVRHLKYLLGRHGGNLPLSLAAYNAGEGAVARFAGRIPPYRETMLYVPAVLARMSARQAVQP